jgi:cytochrome c-type biogenesis protein CcmH/NrfF
MKNLPILFLLLLAAANAQCANQQTIDQEYPTTQAQRAQEFRNLCPKKDEPGAVLWGMRTAITAACYPIALVYARQQQQRRQEYEKLVPMHNNTHNLSAHDLAVEHRWENPQNSN